MGSRKALNKKEEGEEKKVSLNPTKLKEAVRVFKYIKEFRWHFFVGLLLLAASSLVFMVFPVAAGELLNIATGKPQYDYSLEDIGLLLVIVLIVQSVTSFARVLLFAIVSEKGMANLRKSLYEKLISLPITFFENNRVGNLTSRSTADVEQLQSAFSVTLAEFLRQIITLIVGISILFYLTTDLALLMLSTFPFVIIFAMFFGRYIRKLSKERQEELAETATFLEESLHSISVVKSFTNEWFQALRYGKSIDNVVKISLKFARIRGLFIVFIIGILFGTMFFVLYRASLMVQAGDLPVGNLVTFIALTGIIGGAIGGLGNLYTALLSAVGATERIMDILEMPSEVEFESGQETKKIDIKGGIEYKNVGFAYPSRTDVEVLKSIDLKINDGDTVALVGSSGSGKSTIVQLLMRFYDFQRGTISVGGTEIQDYNISEFRKNIAVVPQEVLLFGGSIRENIAYGDPNASEEAIIEAAKQANAWEFISKVKEGLDTIVGERGIKLSGGQRQRIAIARAILRNPKILILDEATSALDAESEKIVQEALNNLMEGRTSIVIAHRLATIRNADCIYVLDDGEIVEQGTHEELAKLDGVYNSLAKLQFELV